MKKFILFISVALFVCLSLSVPALAMTWDTDETSWDEFINIPGNDWEICLNIDSLRSTGYINYDNSGMAGTVCYCDAPARVTLLEYTNTLTDSVVSYVEPMELGGSVISCTVTAEGEIVKGASVIPTYQNPVNNEDFGICNGAGTYWELPEGVYYMFSVNASKTLFLVVGNPASINTASSSVSFSDVAPSDWFYETVNWAVSEKITNGTGNGAFSPDRNCTKAEIITFLWRAAGMPEPAYVGNNYTNPAITEDKYYYKAMLWAFGTLFSSSDGVDIDPDSLCHRSDVVSYLWELSGKSNPIKPASDTVTFVDIPKNANYADAVAWAVDANITQGTGSNTFGPDVVCSRGQIVTFIYRYFVNYKNNFISVSSQDELNALALRTDADQIRKIVAINAAINDLEPLRSMTNLNYLNLYFNIDIGSLDPLRNLTELTFLNLSANGIDDISSLSGLTNLTYLNISGNRITDISALSTLTNLTELNLEFNSSLKDEQIEKLQSQLPNCNIQR